MGSIWPFFVTHSLCSLDERGDVHVHGVGVSHHVHPLEVHGEHVHLLSLQSALQSFSENRGADGDDSE